MPVTAKDIARELELSQPTVSRILNGDQSHRASEATRQRVWDAAQRLGYQPNAVARSLRRGRTDIIGVHTSHNYDVRNDFLGTIVGSLQCACAERHLDIMLHSGVHGSPAQVMFGKLRDGRVDGLILHSSADDPLVSLLNKSSLPVVAVADALPGLPAAVCDDELGMKLLVELLWQRGHRKFVFLAPFIKLPSVEIRQQAFESELQKRGVTQSAITVKNIDFEKSEFALEGLRALGSVAVCCWNDRTAYNLLEAALKAGVRVPQEMAIAGFDGLQNDKIPARILTTVRCPWEDVAKTSLEILIRRIDDIAKCSKSDGNIEIACLPPTLMEGDTV